MAIAKRTGLAVSMLSLAGAACAPAELPQTSTPQLSALWVAETGFNSPESVIYDARRGVLYVSNVAGYTENGQGYLSALGLDGTLVAQSWLDGLNAPTGMGIAGDTLFVADFNRLAEIDIPTARIARFYPAPDDDPGLNDVAISPAGDVFVSASAINAVYRLVEGELELWRTADELLYANGVTADAGHLYVAGDRLNRISFETGEITPFGDDPALNDLETIEPDGAGGFFVTAIGARPIMHLSAEGALTTVLERDSYSADIEVIAGEGLLIAPSGGDTVAAFAIR